jgi:glycosyltransferase involved in cell wall biosynthesis
MRVAVVMTTYQGERWVEEQLRSILEQTRPPDEILVYDDGSTDRTVELVSRLVPVVSNRTRLGTVRNLEQGLRATTGDLVLLADQDDVWHPSRVERLLEVGGDLAFHDADLAGGRTLWERVGFTAQRQRALTAMPLKTLLDGNPVTGATVAVSRRLLDVALPLPVQGWHDYWLALVAASTGMSVVALPERLLDYRLHEDNAAGLPASGLRERLASTPAARAHQAVLLGMLTELAERFPSPEVGQALAHLCFRQGLASSRVRRVAPVGRHLIRGRYALHGGGWRTAAVDLLGKH